ncbi:MAG TPA: class I SAM-dependent methyltransferase [Acidimicrobiia bacterium]|nr:class I SAM-dependent methyltransferase [Acidimicrobiia bacterium]
MVENFFTGPVARDYRSLWPHLYEPGTVDPAVAFLARHAGRGSALELGVGTGRLALPLSARGVNVHGIELSPDMVEQLRLHPGAEAVGITLGDFATEKVEGGAGSFALAYLVRNTIMNLTTQDAQVECFRNVAWHLETGGRFVIEVMVPELRRLPPGTTVRPFALEARHLGFEEYDVATQRSVSHHIFERDEGTELWSPQFRYVWPAELDLMGRLAGMALCERWSDWDRSAFTSDSRTHVSVWQKVAETPI